MFWQFCAVVLGVVVGFIEDLLLGVVARATIMALGFGSTPGRIRVVWLFPDEGVHYVAPAS
jgi:hypothetical protein